jgi:EpsI family protein
MNAILSVPRLRWLSLLLLLLIAAFYLLPTTEYVPPAPSLSALPHTIENWRMVAESQPEPEILELLKADTTLTRVYQNASDGSTASLFVAFFRTQRAGVSPHSPKVCLPGSGWMPERSDHPTLAVPAWDQPIQVNRYIVSRGESKSLVLYWYQTPHRIIAGEIEAKLWLIADGARYRRSDVALVRVIIPVGPAGEQQAFQTAEQFIRTAFPPLKSLLPGRAGA